MNVPRKIGEVIVIIWDDMIKTNMGIFHVISKYLEIILSHQIVEVLLVIPNKF